MGIIHKQYLEGTRIYSCSDCGTHLSTKDDIVSRVRPIATSVRGPRTGGADICTLPLVLFRGSQAFQGQHGRAYLFNTVYANERGRPTTQWPVRLTPGVLRWAFSRFGLHSINVQEGHCQDRQMTTGLHTVRDVYCATCRRVLGWKYVCSATVVGPHRPCRWC